MTLKRIADTRAAQYWDKEHLVSKSIGETDGVVWDYVAVYPQASFGRKDRPSLSIHTTRLFGQLTERGKRSRNC